jgi:hypothetical protein
MSTKPTFADTLQELRKIAGFNSPTELSREIIRLGYEAPSYFELRRYEKGEAEPNITRLAVIADTLGLSQREVMMLVRSAQPERGSARLVKRRSRQVV